MNWLLSLGGKTKGGDLDSENAYSQIMGKNNQYCLEVLTNGLEVLTLLLVGLLLDFCLVAVSFLTFCDPTNCNTPASSVLHYPPEFAQIHVN